MVTFLPYRFCEFCFLFLNRGWKWHHVTAATITVSQRLAPPSLRHPAPSTPPLPRHPASPLLSQARSAIDTDEGVEKSHAKKAPLPLSLLHSDNDRLSSHSDQHCHPQHCSAQTHTQVYKCMQAHTHARTHAYTQAYTLTHTHTQDPWLWKSAPASTTLTTKSLLSLQLFLHWSLTTHQKSLSLWEQHETTASSPLDATCHIKYLIICYSIFPIKLEMFTMHIHTIIYHSVVYANWDDKAGLAAKKEQKEEEEKNKKAKKLLLCCPSDSEEAEVDPGESDRLLWFNPGLCRYNLTTNKEEKRHRERPSHSTRFSVQFGGARVNFSGPGCCQQAEGSHVMSLIGGRWRWDQWQGCAMDAILAGLWCAVCRPGFTRKESLENTAGCHSKKNVVLFCKKKKLFPNTPLFSITSFHSARKNINFIVVIKKCMQVACK